MKNVANEVSYSPAMIGSVNPGSSVRGEFTRRLTGWALSRPAARGAMRPSASRLSVQLGSSQSPHASGWSSTGRRLWMAAISPVASVVMMVHEDSQLPYGERQKS
ncbi:hypothetical protein [Propionibacterium freudenreichii]|uniref:hypothetical protein n=1 Tax=Propionibacterium freudenreichii TaxID=1744 RepID=UPI003D7489AD